MLYPNTSTAVTNPSDRSLRSGAIRRALRSYPDQSFVELLCNITENGARIGYEGPKVRTRRANHASAYANTSAVTDAINKELNKGRLKVLDKLPEYYYCSPIGLVPKKSDGVQTGWRLIFDLSCPEGRSVNDGIPKEYGAISYEALQWALDLVANIGPGAVMIKRDLKSAFRGIWVSFDDHWCLIFEWNGKYYVDMFLPFGLRTSPRIFNLFAEAIHWVLEQRHGWAVSHYLDDFFAAFPPASEITSRSTQFDEVLNEFGFTKAPEKDESGCRVTHLGFVIDSIKMQVSLPPNKLLRAQTAVASLLKHKSVSQNSLEETLGFLSHCCQVVPLGRPFLRQLFALLRRKARFRRTRLSSAAKKDLRWWQTFLARWSTISLIQISRPIHHISTDASGKKGIGGVFGRLLFASRVPSRHKEKHINWKEMFAVLHAFILWHQHWVHAAVDIACDNAAVVDGINKKSIRGPAIRPLRTILLIAAVFDIAVTAHWIPSEENVIADAASRHNFKKLADLGFKEQVVQIRHNPERPKISTLRRKLKNYFNFHLPPQHMESVEPEAPSSRPLSQSPLSTPLRFPGPVELDTSFDSASYAVPHDVSSTPGT